MENVIFFVDGFNLYHSLDSNTNLHKYKWLNISALAKLFLKKNDILIDIYYFTALATWAPEKVKRHKIYIKALELKNVNIIYGEFRRSLKKCPICKKQYRTFEEKQTDVNIAIHLFRLAIQNKYDKAYIISGDSDLIPSIKAVHNTFPQKSLGVIIPIGRRAELLKQTCDFHMKLKEKHLQSSLFEKEIDIGNDKKLVCPLNWQ